MPTFERTRAPGSRGPGRPRAADGHDTQLQLLDAALTKFAVDGLAGTSTRAILQTAGVTSATLYHHFGSKRGLYIATYRYALQLVTEQYERAIAGCASLQEELAAILQAAEQIMRKRHAITALVLRAQTELTSTELAENAYPEPARDFVAGMACRAVERGDVAKGDAMAVELLVPSLLWGLSIVARTTSSRRALVSALTRLIDGELLLQKGPVRARRPG
jgi:AcrR family transcriptional regulator